MSALPFRCRALSQVCVLALLAPFAALPSPALAAPGYFWGDSYQAPEFYSEAPPPRLRRPRPPVLPRGAEKAEKAAAAEGGKPQGPLTIAISIQRQQVKVYDSRGLFAESPISSGMPGHSTPMGVFSVIQKNKYHRSNIYSGAPMPYMQRITWSGVAMHAGVLPGYPASHGCIRMPMSFAMKMWGWTRMGARVVVTPGEVSPADFSHPLLAALVPPAPVAAGPVALNVQTADASGSMVGGAAVTAATEAIADAATVSSTAGAAASSDLAAANVTGNDGLPSVPMPAAVDFSDLGAPVTETVSDDTASATNKSSEPRTDVAVTASATTVDAAPASTPAPSPDPAKDQTQIAPAMIPEPAVAPAAAPAPAINRTQPVAIFVSRKDAKLYVRQNFKPLFDMPIAVAPGEKALGTHVFTARTGKDSDKTLQWSVVSLPAVARQASLVKDERNTGRRSAGAVEVAQTVPSTPDEALARLTLPEDLMVRLGEALPQGSSLVVSDQGIAQGETGEGTDFIVRLR